MSVISEILTSLRSLHFYFTRLLEIFFFPNTCEKYCKNFYSFTILFSFWMLSEIMIAVFSCPVCFKIPCLHRNIWILGVCQKIFSVYSQPMLFYCLFLQWGESRKTFLGSLIAYIFVLICDNMMCLLQYSWKY